MDCGSGGNVRPVADDLRMPGERARRCALCGGPLYYRRILVHRLNVLCKSSGDGGAIPLRHVRRHCAWGHRRIHSRSTCWSRCGDFACGLALAEAANMSQTRAIRLIALMCAAQVLVQIGAFFWPALVPEMIARWRLTNSEAGWITAAFYGAYMLAVPVLVTLTDRVDAKRVYLGGVAAMVLGHALFAGVADGVWSALAARALT